jgi:hypothetical protein
MWGALRGRPRSNNIYPGVWIPGSLASLAPRNDGESFFSYPRFKQQRTWLRGLAANNARAVRSDMPFDGIERAQGMPGEGLTHGPPATKKAGGSHHRCSRTSGIPCAAVLTLIRALPGDRRSCPRRPRARRARDLGVSTGTPGPHDFTSVSTSFVGAIRSRCDSIRPPHPRLASRDDRAQRPSRRSGIWASSTISVKTKVKFFAATTTRAASP